MKVTDEISKIVDNLPEDIQESLLEYLRKIDETSMDKNKVSLNLRKILIEDHQLLSDLAK